MSGKLITPIDFNMLGLNYKTNSQTVLVLISTYNRMEPIIDSIKSILNQDYNNVLLHVIDDNSSENVIGLIKNYIIENNVNNLILSKKNTNTGPYVNFNHILKYHINDEFGYWVLQGSDDISNQKRISTLVNYLTHNPTLNACRSQYVRDVEQITPKYGDSMLICKKNVIYDIGYYDNTRFGGDSDYYNRLILKYGEVGLVPKVLYYANSGDDRLTKKHDKNDRSEYVNLITKEYSKTYYRNFIDVTRDSIVCGIATIESRKESLKKTIESIINQVNKLIVYQNGYYEIFDFLKDPKIEVISSLQTGIDMGDAGKYYKLNEYDNCYYFSVDDDLIYPPTYVSDTLKRCNEFKNTKIVTYHGREFKKFPIKSYYNSQCERHSCLNTVDKDYKIQFGGTGVMCFHTSLVKIPFSYFLYPNMADVWVGKYCLENNIEIICLKHDKNYMGYIPQITTIYDQESKSDGVQTEVVNSIFSGQEKILLEEVKVVKGIQVEIVKPELTKKQINYDKINSIFNANNPKVILQSESQKQFGNSLKLNSQTIPNMRGPKKKFS